MPHLCPTWLMSRVWPQLLTTRTASGSLPAENQDCLQDGSYQQEKERQQEWAWAAVMYQTAITGTKVISDHGMGTQALAQSNKQTVLACCLASWQKKKPEEWEHHQTMRERQPVGGVEPSQSASQGLWLKKVAPHPAGNRSCCHISAPHGSCPPCGHSCQYLD